MLGNCSRFYFRLLNFFKIKSFTNKPPGITIGVSNSLDPDQDRRSEFLKKLIVFVIEFNRYMHFAVFSVVND